MNNMIEKWLDKSIIPSKSLMQLEDSFDRFLNDFKLMRSSGKLNDMSFTPSCEIVEDEKAYVMKFDLPGVSKENVKVEIDQDRLTVTAERKQEKSQDDKKKFLSEISYGYYTRSFTLPSAMDEKKLDAKFKDGVLTVTIPKTETSKTKVVPVQ